MHLKEQKQFDIFYTLCNTTICITLSEIFVHKVFLMEHDADEIFTSKYTCILFYACNCAYNHDVQGILLGLLIDNKLMTFLDQWTIRIKLIDGRF